ncbi:hypothetical protein FQR65_LT04683 [Abscondita terminalis]|nr:hypothetical protein FQR65_LT04683 [Abscondita terminalis]
MESNNFFDGQNKFMYVNHALLQNLKQNQLKVLINPNFVNQMGIKPHFNKNFFTNQTIHVNPNVIRNREKPTRDHVVPTIVAKSNIILSTPTNIIRSPKATESTRTRRTSIHTKYKIIRDTSTRIKAISNCFSARHKNVFAIDRRLSVKKISSPKNINVYVKRNLNKSNYVRINNATNKKSNETKVRSNVKTVGGALKSKILMIRGHKYKLDSSHRTLTLMDNNKCNNESPKSLFKTIYVGGMTFKQKERNVFVKTKVRHQRTLLRQARQKSLNVLTNKHKKSNLPCPLYRKFGKCKGKETGRCIRIHNPEQISLCPKFIQGACTKKYCLLSHKISAEKMPTCKFFLDGLCSKDDCPYLHVKISSKAEICKDFLEGFCKNAAECDKRHQYLCSDFEKTGKCVKKTCPYPHGNVGERKVESKSDVDVKNVEEKSSNVRYYNEAQSSNLKAESSSGHCADKLKTSERPKLGSLPSFIPFNESQVN